MDMARIGATAKGGVNRIAFSDEDRQARDLFRSWCDEAGYAVRVDRFGNMFARRPGRDPDLPAVLVGSHLDSQPTGGKFDGAYGVLSALEVLRSLDDMGEETLRPIEVVNWTNEEGAIFKPMIGSEVFTGALALDKAYAMPDAQGRTLEESLRVIGYAGDMELHPDPLQCYFEVHIREQALAQLGVVEVGKFGSQDRIFRDFQQPIIAQHGVEIEPGSADQQRQLPAGRDLRKGPDKSFLEGEETELAAWLGDVDQVMADLAVLREVLAGADIHPPEHLARIGGNHFGVEGPGKFDADPGFSRSRRTEQDQQVERTLRHPGMVMVLPGEFNAEAV
jgi:N-carbamoyl-L-amino-acid hydrolase